MTDNKCPICKGKGYHIINKDRGAIVNKYKCAMCDGTGIMESEGV